MGQIFVLIRHENRIVDAINHIPNKIAQLHNKHSEGDREYPKGSFGYFIGSVIWILLITYWEDINIKMKKQSILLDLDNTVLIYSKKDGKMTEHHKLRHLMENYEVILYSGRDDIKEYADKWNVRYVWKGDDTIPAADYLIDDMVEQWLPMVNVHYGFSSINKFLKAMMRRRKND